MWASAFASIIIYTGNHSIFRHYLSPFCSKFHGGVDYACSSLGVQQCYECHMQVVRPLLDYVHAPLCTFQVLCGVCNPYSAHLYTRLGSVYPQEDSKEEHGLAMTEDFCEDFVTACGQDLSLPATYCGEHVLAGTTREYWSYPVDISGERSLDIPTCGDHPPVCRRLELLLRSIYYRLPQVIGLPHATRMIELGARSQYLCGLEACDALAVIH